VSLLQLVAVVAGIKLLTPQQVVVLVAALVAAVEQGQGQQVLRDKETQVEL
jgi:hypothetical protein